MSIAVILTVYRRPHLLARQLRAIAEQTLRPDRLLVWQNYHPGVPAVAPRGEDVIHASTNLGVWPRFDAARWLGCEQVCVFDDDTMPGPGWIESCSQRPAGLYGAVGLCFEPGGTHWPRRFVGPGSDADQVVDVVGHSWFMPVAVIETMQSLTRPRELAAGEDYAIAEAAYRLALPVVVPAQPEADRSVWGTTEQSLGDDGMGICADAAGREGYERAHRWAVKEWGWQPRASR